MASREGDGKGGGKGNAPGTQQPQPAPDEVDVGRPLVTVHRQDVVPMSSSP